MRVNDIQTGRYDVKIISGSTLPSNRFALMEYYMDMYREGLIDQVEVLKKSEVVDVEGVLERFSYVKKLEGMVQQLQDQVKKISGDLQTAEREEIHAKKRLEVEKFKSQLSGITNKAAASAEILKVENRKNMQDSMSDQEGASVGA